MPYNSLVDLLETWDVLVRFLLQIQRNGYANRIEKEMYRYSGWNPCGIGRCCSYFGFVPVTQETRNRYFEVVLAKRAVKEWDPN
jgi:hypothetical protein